MIFDSHAHYDDEAFDADREELLAQCQAQGIEYIVNVSASLASVKTTLELPEASLYLRGGGSPSG